jgi:hypothetical protein
MFAATPAAAQDQTVTPPNPAATAQQNPAQPAQNADAPTSAAAAAGTQENAIVVTGLRRSLQSARNIKKNSPQVVDAIVAEDIGKLPDITVSDTAARIPGIEVERSGGEANRVLLRGLDNVYYTTTYNSRELFTAETRSVALQDFPAGAVAAIEAFKTSTANLIEPGIAGLINVRSRRIYRRPVNRAVSEQVDVELPEGGEIVPHAAVGRREPAGRERRIVVAVEGRRDRLVIQRDLRDRNLQVARVPVKVAGAIRRIAIDVPDAPLDLRNEIEMGVIFKIDPALPVLALRLLPFLEKTTESIIVRIGRIEIDELEPRNVAGLANDEIDRLAAIERVIVAGEART